ncbi:hypothetical protein KSX_76860 [Ktedonospora formicarum]|uniref:Uncharacterized protein n=1 Tax=Ktedonospora formicarum TaxID=2778364 RepID=A0A8J3I971_9CHLR|nr:hypothetical protein KSX_76860 [Ktedonospora formicarum]
MGNLEVGIGCAHSLKICSRRYDSEDKFKPWSTMHTLSERATVAVLLKRFE